jgi:hypothetical protein
MNVLNKQMLLHKNLICSISVYDANADLLEDTNTNIYKFWVDRTMNANWKWRLIFCVFPYTRKVFSVRFLALFLQNY